MFDRMSNSAYDPIVINRNSDDYLMEVIRNIPFTDLKAQFLEAQKAELRCRLQRSLLDHGFFSECTAKRIGNDKCDCVRIEF
jgi:hypothetical protein